MSLTKSTFRFAAGGNCETSTSVALAPGHANKAANSNRARRRAFRLIHLRRAESILTRLNISIDVRLTGESLNDSFRRAYPNFLEATRRDRWSAEFIPQQRPIVNDP